MMLAGLFDPNLEGFDVGLNGVSLIPDYNDGQGNFIDGDYSLDSTALDLHEPAKPGDVVIIRSSRLLTQSLQVKSQQTMLRFSTKTQRRLP